MNIKSISVSTEKNWLDAEILFENFIPDSSFHIMGTVFPDFDPDSVCACVSQGIGSSRVLVKLQSLPALASTYENPVWYNFLVKLYDSEDNLAEEKNYRFIFTLPC